MPKRGSDPLKPMREMVEREIFRNYPTVEQFCWDKGLNKATVSNFLRNKKDFRITTLVQIAVALSKDLEIRLK